MYFSMCTLQTLGAMAGCLYEVCVLPGLVCLVFWCLHCDCSQCTFIGHCHNGSAISWESPLNIVWQTEIVFTNSVQLCLDVNALFASFHSSRLILMPLGTS